MIHLVEFILWQCTARRSAGATSRTAIGCALATCCLSAPAMVSAQQWVPTRSLRFIVPAAPGGSTDLLARMISPPLGNALGQQIVVDNRGGAGGIIAMEAVARAQPDGYTLGLLSLSQHAANATLVPRLPYDSVKDFLPLTYIGHTPLVFGVHPSNPAQSVRDLIVRAKAAARPINFATGGIGLAAHIAGELLRIEAKADLVHVPYKGGGPAVADLMGGAGGNGFRPFVHGAAIREKRQAASIRGHE